MSIQKISPDDLEYFTIETHPSRSYSARLRRTTGGAPVYVTASNGVVEEVFDATGSVYIFSNRSESEKELFPLSAFRQNSFKDFGVELLRKQIIRSTSTDINSLINTYMSSVHASTSSLRTQKKLEIIRFIPTFNFTSNTVRKKLIVDHLIPYYRQTYNNCHFGIINYNSLHFFSPVDSSNFPIPTNSAILYPNGSGSLISSGVYVSDYGFKSTEGFSFDFWIKPSYKNTGSYYNAGTILQLSGAYAISIHSGSSVDANGKADKFKIALQLGVGSTIQPSQITSTDAANGVFVTSDNVLDHNRWHHVSIVHGGPNYNNSTGSIFIDQVNQCTFTFQNNGFALHSGSNQPDALCIGSFYEGPNLLADFFNTNAALRDGIQQLSNDTSDPDFSDFSFTHPLEGELHDIKIYNKCLNSDEIASLQVGGPSSYNNLKFYLPPFFTEESPTRTFVGEWGGVLVTPFQEKNGTTTKPFGAELAFAVGGHYMNLENYVRDFATGKYPRLWYLTGSSIEAPSSIIQSANAFLYDSGTNVGANKKRLYSVMPCDHGGWSPNYMFLETLSGAQPGGIYSNDLGNKDIAAINLRNIIPDTAITASKAIYVSGAMLKDVLGAGPELDQMRYDVGDGLTILHRLRDNSSQQVAIFDVSNMFYGKRIKPGSITLSDPKLSGSDGKISITLKDDARGNIYRADSFGPHATWNSVGNVFYDEGLIILNAPQLFFFGKEGFDLSFKGIQNVHVLTINAFARPMQLLSSSNPTYQHYDFDDDLANEPDQKFVYITSLNIHDENLNVVARTHLAQPIAKKSGDKMLFKFKLDF
jgi:hypothetical protein